MPSPEAAFLLERVEVRHFVKELPMAVYVIVCGEEAIESAAFPEHPELLPGLPVGRRQHEQQHAQVLSDVPGLNPLVFSSVSVQPAGAMSSCWR